MNVLARKARQRGRCVIEGQISSYHRFWPKAAPFSSISVHEPPRVDESAVVHPSAILLGGVIVGPRCTVGPLTVVGPNVRFGAETVVGAGCVLAHASVGDNVVLHPGVKVGQDGFGFIPGTSGDDDEGCAESSCGAVKKPQQLGVIIENDVEIGANTTVDRGSWRDTVIGRGSKLDNLIQIGHNVWVGQHCLICAQVGIAGSCTIGDYVLIGGQAGIAQHLNVGDQAQIAAKSGVMRHVLRGERVGGVPAVAIAQFHRQSIFLNSKTKR